MKKKILMGVAIHLSCVLSFCGAVSANARHQDGATPVANNETNYKSNEEPRVLDESVVVSKFMNVTRNPLRIKVIDNEQIKMKAAATSYPEMIGNLPGVYATSENGSFGDAKVNIRGFKQENISILLNGIPISGQTSGNMFWSNWMGLTDATYAIQVQKGAGTSMLSDNSVGGTINIITQPATSKLSTDFGLYATHWGSFKGYFNINSGNIGKGWKLNLMASYLGGPGYVEETEVSTFSYLLTISKAFEQNHSLTLTAIGSPEKHGQRSSKLNFDDIEKYGLRYNKNWGWLDGKPYNLSKNNYFKPYFTLQHRFDNGKTFMQNSIYLAIANGGGRWNESKGPRMQNMINSDGRINFDKIKEENNNCAEGGKEAKFILSDFMAGHTQIGAIISGGWHLPKGWELELGTHYQHYATWEKERITDMLGADYWLEKGEQKHVGDYIRTNNGKTTDHFTLYAQAQWNSEKWNATLGVSGIGALIRRWDKYNYEANNIWSDRAKGLGCSVKGGVLWHPAAQHSLYINGGVYSRVPYSGTYFSSGNNDITRDVRNELNLMAELGWRFIWPRGTLELTVYDDLWRNRSIISDPYKPADGTSHRSNITGLNARHFGFEANVAHRFTSWFNVSAFASLAKWYWLNDVSAKLYDDYTNEVVKEVNVYTKNLFVGDAPMTQIGAALDFDIPYGFQITIGWVFNDRMYADFDPAKRTDPEDRTQSWILPSYHLLDLHLSWSGNLGKRCGMTIFAEGKNLLNSHYIIRGKDGKGHDQASFTGFWGFGANANFGIRLTPNFRYKTK